MAAKDSVDAWWGEGSLRHQRRLQAGSLARERQREMEDRQDGEHDRSLLRLRTGDRPRSAARGESVDDWLIDEQEPQDWIDAEQEVQRMLGIDDDGPAV